MQVNRAPPVSIGARLILVLERAFTDVRVKVDMVCEGVAQSEIDALVTHVKKWSPVANTFTRPVNLEVSA